MVEDSLKEFWDAYWMNLPDMNVLCIEHYILTKENKFSLRYHIVEEQYEIKNTSIINTKKLTRKITIKKDKVYSNKVYSMPKFKSRSDALGYLIEHCTYEIESCKLKLEKLPKVVEILKTIQNEEKQFGEEVGE